jgi:hypothetical protein
VGEEEKEKSMIVNNIEIHNICAGRGYNNMHSKLLKNGAWK